MKRDLLFCGLCCGLLLLSGLGVTTLVQAEDWPQFLGPRRDGTSKETGLRDSWPKDGPPILWQRKAGEGFSGPVVAGERLILFHRVDGKEVVECLEAATGKPLWQNGYACDYQDGFGKGDGPRSTPVIAGDRVYTLGVDGQLQCLRLQDGQRVWNRSLHKDYNIPPNFFGVGTSPLVAAGRVLVNVGGKEAGIVAFAAQTGKELWRSTSDGASYSSPVLAQLGGKTRAVFFTRNGVVVLDPVNGKVQHQQTWRARYAASVNAATPLVLGELLFFSASYETGALLLRDDQGQFREVWKGEDIMSNHYNTCVYHEGHLYGIDGRQETGPDLRCIELRTGKVKWTQENFGCASLILAGNKLICLTEAGDLVLLDPTPKQYQEISRATVLTAPPCRAQIALSDGRLYGRDNSRLVCWNLRK